MKALIALALIALTLQACVIENSEASLSAMCILKSDENEHGRVLFRQTGCNTPLSIKGIFDVLPANVTSLINIHQYGVLDTCDNIGSIFMPNGIQPKGYSIKTDVNGDGSFSMQNQDYSLRGVSSLVGRSCRVRIPYTDQTGVARSHYACGTIGFVSERIADSFGQGTGVRHLQGWRHHHRHRHWPWWRCRCPPWRWWCHRPWWCWW
jgi:hypothetical protein